VLVEVWIAMIALEESLTRARNKNIRLDGDNRITLSPFQRSSLIWELSAISRRRVNSFRWGVLGDTKFGISRRSGNTPGFDSATRDQIKERFSPCEELES
jgi:hypothetical protein